MRTAAVKFKIYIFLSKFGYKNLAIQNKIETEVIIQKTEKIKEEIKLDLVPIKDFLEDYLGLIIIDFRRYKNKIEDVRDDISVKFITEVVILPHNKIKLVFSNISGKKSGNLVIDMSLTGQFSERRYNEIPIWSSMYRIFFFGGDSVEYSDTEELGEITYNE